VEGWSRKTISLTGNRPVEDNYLEMEEGPQGKATNWVGTPQGQDSKRGKPLGGGKKKNVVRHAQYNLLAKRTNEKKRTKTVF